MVNVADIQPGRVRPLRRAEYERLVEIGAFDDEKIELLDGMLITMTPQDAAHAHTVHRLAETFTVALMKKAIVRVQSPLALLDDAEPEPDVAIVPLGDYSSHHPTAAHLVVEVATSSQHRDRRVKAPIYARSGIPEYWLVDLKARTVEVYSDPRGSTFRTSSVHDESETLRLSSFPDVAVDIRSVLPTPA